MVYNNYSSEFSSPEAQRICSGSPTLTARLLNIYAPQMAVRKRTSAGKILQILGGSSGRGRGRHSPVYLWFHEHHDELEAGFKQTSPSWQVISDALAEQGLRNADGTPPAAETARAAWWRVRRDVKLAKGMASSRSRVAVGQAEMPLGVRFVVQPSLPCPPSNPGVIPPLTPLADDRPRMPMPKFRSSVTQPQVTLPPLPDDRPRMPPLKVRRST